MGHLRLLLWKNAVLKRRNLFSTFSEVLLPLSFVFLLVWLQTLDKDKEMLERDWTCPAQSGFSPTIFESPYIENKAVNNTKRNDDFFFAVNTEGMGAGLQTIPPFLYALTLAAKTESKIALVSSDAATREWLERFAGELDHYTRPLEKPIWQGISKALSLLEIPFCRFSRLAVFFNSSKELDEYVTSAQYGTGDWPKHKNGCPRDGDLHENPLETKPKLFAAIELHSGQNMAFEYALRMNMSVLPVTYPKVGLVDPLQKGIDPLWQDNYVLSGFLTLQLQMDRHLIGVRSSDVRKVKQLSEMSICDSLQPLLRQLSAILKKPALKKIDCMKVLRGVTLTGLDLLPLVGPASYIPNQVRIAPFPTPDYLDRPFYKKIQDVMSLVLLMCYLWPTSRLIRGIVDEKETRLRETLLQMGVPSHAVMLSHIITYGIIFTLIALLITVTTRFNVFSTSSPLLVFLFFFLFGLTIVTYSFMVSVLFDRAKTASTAGVSLFFVTYMPFFAVNAPNASATAKFLTSLFFSPTAFGVGTTLLASYEASGEGLNFGNFQGKISDNQMSFFQVLVNLFFECWLYFALGWYLNQVVHSEFGIAKPYWFLCSREYWMGRKHLVRTARVEQEEPLLLNEEDPDVVFVEKPTEDLLRLEKDRRCIKTFNLRKEFPVPSSKVGKVAVENLNLTFYEGQIFVLLAPNGSGKSTTIRMLTGDTAPTEGRAELYGQDMAEAMDSLRKSMGVCPQHDCLWRDMTVEEHLQFVAAQKGLEGKARDKEVEDHIRLVGMENKRFALSKNLSGGQKRKLSLAMALIGGSRLVFLDEPTSGMDSHSRRFVWQLLQQSKQNRIIILTTHFLDEADFLGDRIAIMANGKLKCVGSSHYLKSKYGVGYTLTCVQPSDSIKRMIATALPQAKVLSAMGSELSFQIPFASAEKFPALFAQLDESIRTRKDLEGYGVSVTTLEEVFVKVALGGDESWAKAEEERVRDRATLNAPSPSPNKPITGAELLNSSSLLEEEDMKRDPSGFAVQFRALFLKRFQYSKRDKRSVCCNTFIPVLLLIVGLGMLKLFPLPEPPALDLTEKAALQISDPQDKLECVVDSPELAQFVPQSVLVDLARLPFPHENNNCTEDELGANYYSSASLKRFSTLLRKQAFHGFGLDKNLAMDVQEVRDLDAEVSDVDLDALLRELKPDYSAEDMVAFKQAMDMLNVDGKMGEDSDVTSAANRPKRRWMGEAESHLKKLRFGALHVDEMDWSKQKRLVTATVFANSTAMHSTSVYLSLLNQALLRKAKASPSASIKAINAPFKFTARFQQLISTFSAVSASITIIMAFSFIPAAVAVFVVREREVAAKHQQLLAGTSLISYWVSNFVFDALMFCVPWIASLLCVYIFGISAFQVFRNFVALSILFLSYGLAIIPFTYLTSFAFESHSTAQNVVLLINFITGLVLTIASFVMSVIESTYKINQVLAYVYRIFPGFCLGNGLLSLTINESKKTFGDGVLIKAENVFSMDVIGVEILYLLIESLVYFSLTVLLDFSFSDPLFVSKLQEWFRRSPRPANNKPLIVNLANGAATQDEDVEREQERVDEGRIENDVVVVKHLRKEYAKSKLIAVHDLTFGIKKGDIFALLGVNGAGKSTTLKMLSGEILPTSGTAFVENLNILTQQKQVRKLIGYCPQFDALLDLLTVREHLELFGKLKGVRDLEREVVKKMHELRLEEFENRLAGTLSGGNKRKLSIAIALIGDPPLILADEPTTGVDALNRRFLCDVIADYSVTRSKGCVILTTHSMEEVEALGTRVGIMSQGRFKCLGSIQHLKNKFGKGIVFRVRLESPEVAQVDALLRRSFRGEDEVQSWEALSAIFTRLGRPDRLNRVDLNDPTGWVLKAALDRDGKVDARMVAQWIIAEDECERFERFVENNFPNAALVEKRPSQYVYRVEALQMQLGECFGLFEKAKVEYGLQEYSVSGTSLESIFISLAQQQHQQQQVAA